MNILKTVRDIIKCQQTDPQNIPILRLHRLCFMSYLHNLVLWQGFQYPKKRKMVNLRTEEQDHEYLENGKRYQKMSKNRPPKTCTFYVYISQVLCPIFIIWRFSRDFKIQNSLKWSIWRVFIFSRKKVPCNEQGCLYPLYFGKTFAWGFQKGATYTLSLKNGWEKYISNLAF